MQLYIMALRGLLGLAVVYHGCKDESWVMQLYIMALRGLLGLAVVYHGSKDESWVMP